MTPKQIASELNGIEYTATTHISSSRLAKEAKAAGIVIAYGMSDDLIEFDGAIHDELGACNGTEILLTSDGLLQSKCHEGECCPYFDKIKAGAAIIEARWCAEPGYSWTYRTTIPHETFEIVEDGEPYCRGIVFRLADIWAPASSFKPWTAIHLKTGNEYEVIGEAIDATNSASNRPMVIYARDGKTFVRCAEEFVEKFKAKERA